MRLKLGTRWENLWTRHGALEVYPEWRDLWVGIYVGPDAIYVCPLPCVVFRFSRGSRVDPITTINNYIRDLEERTLDHEA